MFKMTPNVLRNLFTKKATRRYPDQVRPAFDGMRGALSNAAEACTLCGVCAAKCPSQCLAVDKNAGTWRYDPFACVLCGICVDVCPAKCLDQTDNYPSPLVVRETITLKPPPRKKKEQLTATPQPGRNQEDIKVQRDATEPD